MSSNCPLRQTRSERTSTRIPDHYITPDNFQSVVAIGEMLAGCRTASPAGRIPYPLCAARTR
jgi:hypothetical protein